MWGTRTTESAPAEKNAPLLACPGLVINSLTYKWLTVAFTRSVLFNTLFIPPLDNQVAAKLSLQVTNCREVVNGNPGSLVGHVAVRAHVYHLCMNVNRGCSLMPAQRHAYRSIPAKTVAHNLGLRCLGYCGVQWPYFGPLDFPGILYAKTCLHASGCAHACWSCSWGTCNIVYCLNRLYI